MDVQATMNHSGLDYDRVNELPLKRNERKGRKLDWFKKRDGVELRLKVKTHVMLEEKRSRCQLCNVHNSFNKGSIKTVKKCNTCGVFLCIKKRGYNKTCSEVWHTEPDLYRRINMRHEPRHSAFNK